MRSTRGIGACWSAQRGVARALDCLGFDGDWISWGCCVHFPARLSVVNRGTVRPAEVLIPWTSGDAVQAVRVTDRGPDHIHAVVSEVQDFDVRVTYLRDARNRDNLLVSCTCPYFDDYSRCKHIWAVILEASHDRSLPNAEYARFLRIDREPPPVDGPVAEPQPRVYEMPRRERTPGRRRGARDRSRHGWCHPSRGSRFAAVSRSLPVPGRSPWSSRARR